MPRFLATLLLFSLAQLLTSCQTTSSSGSGGGSVQAQARRAVIAAEPPGDYYVGRRFHIARTQFWGYVRRPGESWDKSRLVIMSEKFARQPDRLPEVRGDGGPIYGSDHNHEYRLWGRFSGRRVYDPNSNLILPEFTLERYQLTNASPGWLFKPDEKFDGERLLRGEVGSTPGGRR